MGSFVIVFSHSMSSESPRDGNFPNARCFIVARESQVANMRVARSRKKTIAPRNYFARNGMRFVVFETPIASPRRKKHGFGTVGGSPLCSCNRKNHGFAKPTCSCNRKTMVFEVTSDGRLAPEGPAGEAPVHELQITMKRVPDTSSPQLNLVGELPCHHMVPYSTSHTVP